MAIHSDTATVAAISASVASPLLVASTLAAAKQRIAIALWDYDAQEDNELSFETGDRILITEFCNDDWFEGSLGPLSGFFPANHVKVLPEASSITVLPVSTDSLRHTPTSGSSELPSIRHSDTSVFSSDSPSLANGDMFKSDRDTSSSFTHLREGSNVSYSDSPNSESPKTQQNGDSRSSFTALDGRDSAVQDSTHIWGSGSYSENRSEENLDSDGWHMVTTEDGQTYYWNSATGETSWDAPYGDTPSASLDNLHIEESPHSEPASMQMVSPRTESGTPSNVASVSAPHTAAQDSLRIASALAHIEFVVPELIRREGWLAYKSKKEFGGVEPKKTHSWHNHWAIICVGFLIFYKDEPNRLKKRSDKQPVGPSLVVTLESITISREKDPNKKKQSVFNIQTRSGAVWALQPQNDSELNEWITTISEATREASTMAEYENVTAKLFSHAPISDIQVECISKKRGDDKKSLKQDIKKKEKSFLANEADEADSGNNKVKIKTKLNAFFKRQQEKGSSLRDGDKKDDALSDAIVFGGLLEAQVAVEGRSIPIFVETCITAINNRGLNSQGIYRLSGNAATIQRIKAQINQGEGRTELNDDTLDLNAISGLLKLYFRELKDPLFPFAFYDRFIACMKMDDYNERLIEIKTLIQALPKSHYVVIEFLMRHLVQIAAHSEINKMEPSNLAIVFGPTIIRVPSSGTDDMQAAYANMMNMSFQNALVEAIIVQTEWIFDGSSH
ncbi:hypothetical protein BASA83_008330 [Batrachochytrium salamandrivorans]|nr:hypothetical protein BASA83_008330 [Batrachochytrium salamandrivorans]